MKPRAPAHMLRTYAAQYRPLGDLLIMVPLGKFTALTSTGALVQAAHALARQAVVVVEIVVTEQGE